MVVYVHDYDTAGSWFGAQGSPRYFQVPETGAISGYYEGVAELAFMQMRESFALPLRFSRGTVSPEESQEL